MRLKHYSLRTERTCCDWIENGSSVPLRALARGDDRRDARRPQKPVLRWRQPSDMRENEVSSFLTYMAREGKVPASTQNQAFSGHAVYWVRDSDPGI